jgi:hypothetical protein
VAESLRSLPSVSPLALVEHFAGVLEGARRGVREGQRRGGRGGGGGHAEQQGQQQEEEAEGALVRRFALTVEAEQLAARAEQAEADAAGAREELLKLKFNVAEASNVARREREALEEAHRLAEQGWERRVAAVRQQAKAVGAEAGRLRLRIEVLEEELGAERAAAAARRVGRQGEGGGEGEGGVEEAKRGVQQQPPAPARAADEERDLQVCVCVCLRNVGGDGRRESSIHDRLDCHTPSSDGREARLGMAVDACMSASVCTRVLCRR